MNASMFDSRNSVSNGAVPDGFGLAGAESEQSLFDVRKALTTVWREKWFVLFFGLIGLLYGTFVVLKSEPVYESSATIIFEPNRLQPIDPLDVVAEPERTTNLGDQIEILNSSSLLDRVVERVEKATAVLSQDDAMGENAEGDQGNVGSGGLFATSKATLSALVESLIGPDRDLRPDPAFDPGEASEDVLAARRLAQRESLRRSLAFNQIGGSRVIEIAFLSSDPMHAALVANTVGEEYIAFQEVLRNEEADSIIALMNQRIGDLKDRLDESEGRLEVARLEISQYRAQSADMLNTQLNALNRELANIRLKLAEAEARHARAATALEEEADLWSVTEFRESQFIARLRTRALDIREQIAQNTAITGGAATPAKTVNLALLEEVERSVREEATFIVSSLQFAVESLQGRERQLTDIIRDLERSSIEQTSDEVRIERLQREVNTNQTIYESFVDRLREISEQANFQSADARFLSRAEAPLRPDYSVGLRMLAAATAAGLMGGLGLMFLREELNRSVRSADELSSISGLKVLGAVPLRRRKVKAKKNVCAVSSEPAKHFVREHPQSSDKRSLCRSRKPAKGGDVHFIRSGGG